MEIRQFDNTEDYLKRAQTVLAVIASYPRRAKRLPPPPTSSPSWPRGVYEMEVAPNGYRAFNVVYSNGDISFHQFPTHRATRDLIRGLQRALDRDDPTPALSLLKPDAPSSSRP